jgi:hypothetical protein
MAGEIEEANPRERRRSRIFHYIGCALFTTILVAALAGLLGQGPLTNVSAQAGPVHVRYWRFVRHHAYAELKIDINGEATSKGVVGLRLQKPFVESVDLQRIEPEPIEATVGAEFSTYWIRVATNAPASVRVRFVPERFGRLPYEVGLAGSPAVPMWHFVLP